MKKKHKEANDKLNHFVITCRRRGIPLSIALRGCECSLSSQVNPSSGPHPGGWQGPPHCLSFLCKEPAWLAGVEGCRGGGGWNLPGLAPGGRSHQQAAGPAPRTSLGSPASRLSQRDRHHDPCTSSGPAGPLAMVAMTVLPVPQLQACANNGRRVANFS